MDMIPHLTFIFSHPSIKFTELRRNQQPRHSSPKLYDYICNTLRSATPLIVSSYSSPTSGICSYLFHIISTVKNSQHATMILLQ